MLKRFLIGAALLLAACQSAMPTETTLITPSVGVPTGAPTDVPTGFPTDIPSGNTTVSTTPSSWSTPAPDWLETQMNGVSLGMWTPDGWETDVSDGLVMAEHPLTRSGAMMGGMLVYVFVPLLDDFNLTEGDSNFAWAVLDKVVKMPSHTGHDVTVSDPTGFKWGEYDAAYYLLTTGDGVRVFVLAVALPGLQKVVVCNISIPANQANRIRAMLPQLLNGLTVNGMTMSGAALDVLPDPLPFPRYMLISGTDNQTISGSPPDNPPDNSPDNPP